MFVMVCNIIRFMTYFLYFSVTHQSTISETPLNTGNLSSCKYMYMFISYSYLTISCFLAIVGIFSPLDTTHSSYITTTRPSLIDNPPPPLITTITSTFPTALTNTNSTLPQSTNVSPSIQTTIPTTQVTINIDKLDLDWCLVTSTSWKYILMVTWSVYMYIETLKIDITEITRQDSNP